MHLNLVDEVLQHLKSKLTLNLNKLNMNRIWNEAETEIIKEPITINDFHKRKIAKPNLEARSDDDLINSTKHNQNTL